MWSVLSHSVDIHTCFDAVRAEVAMVNGGRLCVEPVRN